MMLKTLTTTPLLTALAMCGNPRRMSASVARVCESVTATRPRLRRWSKPTATMLRASRSRRRVWLGALPLMWLLVTVMCAITPDGDPTCLREVQGPYIAPKRCRERMDGQGKATQALAGVTVVRISVTCRKGHDS